jgi:hypothetical protein
MRITTRMNDEDKVLYDMYMTRGDSEGFTVYMTDADNNDVLIPFVQGDTVYFTVKISNSLTNAIRKVITTFTQEGHAAIELDPADTATLKTLTYIYDVRTKKASGRVITLMHKANFEIESEVGSV